MEETKRCFIALDLPREAIDEIREIQGAISKKNLFAGKSTEVENLHLTLKFLGEIDEEKIEKVKERLKKIKLSDFEASLGGVGVFSERFIRIIWIELSGKEVFDLQKKIDESLSGLFEPEARFMSHITIARVKSVKDKKSLLDYVKKIRLKNFKFKINEFSLKKSELLFEGPHYENLGKYVLLE